MNYLMMQIFKGTVHQFWCHGESSRWKQQQNYEVSVLLGRSHWEKWHQKGGRFTIPFVASFFYLKVQLSFDRVGLLRRQGRDLVNNLPFIETILHDPWFKLLNLPFKLINLLFMWRKSKWWRSLILFPHHHYCTVALIFSWSI